MALNYPRVLLWSYGTVLLVGLLVAASTSGAAFGAFNSGWNGASELRSEAADAAEASIVRDVGAYDEVPADRTVAVVLSPDRPYTNAEAAEIRSFVRRGGTLVVAEDFGPFANSLLAEIGAGARVDGRLLRDERNYHRSPALPVAGNVSDHSLVSDVESATLNHGSVVRPNNATVLVSSSEFSYLDENRNGNIDDSETLTGYPVVTVEEVGEGRVIVVSDPSLFVNAMLEREGNRAFVRSLFAAHERVLLDYSHGEPLPPLWAAVFTLRDSSPLQLLVGLVAVTSLAGWVRRPDVVARIRGAVRPPDATETIGNRAIVDDSALVEYLAEQQPDWDRERVRRVVEAVRRRE